LNNAIGRLKALTAYNAESKTGGVLLGDSTARKILTDLQTAVSSFTLSEGEYRHSGAIGIAIQRDGTVKLDESKLRAALQEDYQGVSRLLSRWGSTSNPRVQFVRSGSNSVDGSYEIVITQAATAASVTGAAYTPPGADVSFQIISGSKAAEVTVTSGADLNTAVDAINAALSAAGITTVTASA